MDEQRHNVTSTNYSENRNNHPQYKATSNIWLQKERAGTEMVACAGPQTATTNNWCATGNTTPAGLSFNHFLNIFFHFC